MGRDIAECFREVMATAHNRIAGHNNGTDGNFPLFISFAGFPQSEPHIIFVGIRKHIRSKSVEKE